MIFNTSIGLSSITIIITIFIFLYLTSKIFQISIIIFSIFILYFIWKNEIERYKKK
jgi:predicted signal transduction protein with EAL and GGDEF domain